jgi:hypothetical protein
VRGVGFEADGFLFPAHLRTEYIQQQHLT